MTAPALTPEQEAALIAPRYNRLLRILTPDPQRLVPLIGRLRLELDGAESGAPMADLTAPLAGAEPWEAVAEALGTDAPQALLDGWLDMAPLVKLAALHGRIDPGTYTLRNVTPERLLEVLAGYGGMTPERAGFTPEGQVALTEAHIALQRNLQWQWTHRGTAEEVVEDGSWPGPSGDAKRVYGEMSFVELDMHRILGLPIEARTPEGYIALSETQVSELSALHLTVLAATQAFVENVTLDLSTPDAIATRAQWETWASN